MIHLKSFILPSLKKRHGSINSSRCLSYSSSKANNNNNLSQKISLKSKISNFRTFHQQNFAGNKESSNLGPGFKLPPIRKRVSTSLIKTFKRPLNYSMSFLNSDTPNNQLKAKGNKTKGQARHSFTPLLKKKQPHKLGKTINSQNKRQLSKRLTIFSNGKIVCPQFLMSPNIKNIQENPKSTENSRRVRTKSSDKIEDSKLEQGAIKNLNIGMDNESKPQMVSSSLSPSSSSTSSSSSSDSRGVGEGHSRSKTNLNMTMFQRSRSHKRSSIIGLNQTVLGPTVNKNRYRSSGSDLFNNPNQSLVLANSRLGVEDTGLILSPLNNLGGDELYSRSQPKKTQHQIQNTVRSKKWQKLSQTFIASNQRGIRVKRSSKTKITQILGHQKQEQNSPHHQQMPISSSKQVLVSSPFNSQNMKLSNAISSNNNLLAVRSLNRPKIFFSHAETMPVHRGEDGSPVHSGDQVYSPLLTPQSLNTLKPKMSMRSITQVLSGPIRQSSPIAMNSFGLNHFTRGAEPRMSQFFKSRLQGTIPRDRRLRQKTDIVKQRDPELFSSFMTTELEIKKEVDYQGIESSEQINEYSLCEMLGQGAYASVYKAISLKNRQLYVIPSTFFC